MRPPFLAAALLTLAPLLLTPQVGAGGNETDEGARHRVRLGETVSSGQRLEIRLATGASLNIASWDRREVLVESERTEALCPDAMMNLTRTSGGALLETRYKPGSGETHQCSMAIDVHVPSRFDIRVRSAGGSIRIMDMGGTFEGRTGGGSIELAGLRGHVDLHTGGGRILVRDAYLDGSLTTGSGSVRFDNVQGGVTATSGSVRGVTRGRSRSI